MKTRTFNRSITVALAAATCLAPGMVLAQAQVAVPAPTQQVQAQTKPPVVAPKPVAATPAGAAVAMPGDYIIGLDDVLAVFVLQEKDMSAQVFVRPDGKITLPMINDVQAQGLTPDQLRQVIAEKAIPFVKDPTVVVQVTQINSRKVHILGQVAKQGPYLLTAPTSVMQMLANAGGLLEYAKKDKISITRTENGQPKVYKFNYKEVSAGKKLQQNIELKPGDVINVP